MSKNLKSMTLPEIAAVLKELGQPAFRAKQLFSWLHKGVRSFDEMTNLPQSLRQALETEYPRMVFWIISWSLPSKSSAPSSRSA